MMTYLNTECLNLPVLGNTVEVLYSFWKDPPKYLYTEKGIHSHTSPEVHYSIDGTNVIVIENQLVHIHPGDAIIIAPNVIHNPQSLGARANSFSYHIHERAGALEALIPEGKFRLIYGVNLSYMQMIREEFEQKRPGWHEKLKLLFQLCLIDLVRCAGGSIPAPAETMTHHQLGVIIDRYITTNLNVVGSESSKADLARQLNISLRQLERVMQSIFGMSYSEFYNKHRFKMAYRMVHDMNMKAGEVAAFLGYANEANFSRAFKKYYGFSPSKLSLCETSAEP